ncbi:dihydrodipicolinate synthase family protein [Sulfurisphaera javensis]|uniref:Dihydrodipicolinate synthase family protein n=1 Tax=Sulfurisphaera javensis TaxID=2049879 RepID=A0AAT9GPD8_9CREN
MKGIIPAIVTPFKENEELDLDALETYIQFLKRNGIEYFFVLGTTGEFNMLTLEEKIQFLKKLSNITKNAIVNVTENSLYNALKLAKTTLDLGFQELASLPPLYHKPSEKGIIKYYEELSKFGLPLNMYYYPQNSYSISQNVIETLVEEGIIQGIKYTTNDLVSFKNLLSLKEINKEFNLLIGNDELILDSFLVGGDGVISAVANIAPEIVIKEYELLKNGNISEAIKIQKIIDRINKAIQIGDYPATLKNGLKYRGIYVGRVRSPLQESVDGNSLIYGILKEIGL